MIPTPDLSHLTKEDYLNAYEPAEDTFLLLDALELDIQTLINMQPTICLEVGSGSGCVSAFIARALGPSTLYLCTDVNEHAARCTLATGFQNNVVLDPVIASLAFPLRSRLKNTIDIILFNPPYVPTSVQEADNAQSEGNIESSWAGGINGMQITDHLLRDVKNLLSPGGYFYLVALKQNDIPAIRCAMSQDHGLRSEIVLQRRAGREHLFVLRFCAHQ